MLGLSASMSIVRDIISVFSAIDGTKGAPIALMYITSSPCSLSTWVAYNFAPFLNCMFMDEMGKLNSFVFWMESQTI